MGCFLNKVHMTLKITHLPFFKSCVMNKLSISYRDGHEKYDCSLYLCHLFKKKKKCLSFEIYIKVV